MALGGALYEGNSKLFTGPLGVVSVGFKGYDLGKTTADSNLTPEQDIKDIMYQQDGSKAADHVRTGIDYLLNVTFGEIKTGLIDLLMSGISTQNTSAASDSGHIDRVMYESMRDVEKGGMKVAAVDVNGVPSTSLQDIMNFYEVIPIVNGELVNWGADTQRNLPVQFRIKWHEFTVAELAALTRSSGGAFGYWGDPTTEDVTDIAAYYPDVEAPILLTVDADATTNLVVTFNENIAAQTAFEVGMYACKVDGVLVLPTAEASLAGAVLNLTFPAATFSAAAEIYFYCSELAIEDTEATANTYGGISDFLCTDSI